MNRTTVANTDFKKSVKADRTLTLIIIPVVIDGKKYRFLWDTGAITVISPELKEKLGLKKKATNGVRDSGGQVRKLVYTNIPSLSVADIEFENVGAAVADLNNSVLISCLKIDGIIGGNMMKRAVWKLDMSTNTLWLASSPEKFELPSNYASVSFDIKNHGTPYVKVQIDSHKLKNITFDTGYSGFLSTSRAFANDSSTSSQLHTYRGYNSSGLYGKKLSTRENQLRWAGLDSATQIKGEVDFYNRSKSLLGMEYIEQFEMILDWKTRTISYWKNSDAAKDTFYMRTVVPRYNDGYLIVGTVLQDSSKVLPQAGDSILIWNNQKVWPLSREGFCAMIDTLKNSPDTTDFMTSDSTTYQSIKFELN